MTDCLVRPRRLRLSFNSLAFHFLFCRLSGEVLAGEFDDVGRVVPDHLLGEVLEDLGELVGNDDLLSRENSHLSNVCHL